MHKIKPENTFTCVTCGTEHKFEILEIKTHLKEVHGIAPDVTSGSRTMLAHMYAADYYTYTFMWKFGDIELRQYILEKRKDPW
jgi:hypothetical protein